MSLNNVIGIIPARYASTRFPGKPLVLIGDKPMVQWVYEQSAKALNHVYVATDDNRIYEAVKRFGGNAVMTSPDHQSGTDRCVEALDAIEKALGREFDVVINIQGDEPFIDPRLLITLQGSFSNPVAEIATLVKPLVEEFDLNDPNKCKVVFNMAMEAIYFSRAPIPYPRSQPSNEIATHHPYYQHVGIYAYRSKVLREIALLSPSRLELTESLEQLRWLENGYKIHVNIVEHASIGIDTPEDLARVIKNGLPTTT